MELLIKIMPNGTVGVQGPLDQLGLCYQMLELAKDAIREHHQKAKAGIALPSPAMTEQLVGRRNN